MKYFSLIRALTPMVCLAIVSLPALAGQNTIGAASISKLRCEYLENPMSVDASAPRLSWAIAAKGRGWMQTAYRVQVASTADLLSANRADLWDSGKVASSQSVGIRYTGKPLDSGKRCFWRVQVWNNDGIASGFSATQNWQMGLLRPTDWKAQWISARTPRDTKVDGIVLPPSPYLRKTFTLTKSIRRATLFATARGVYELRLNGAKINDHVLAPGWTDYRKRIQYQATDVTHLIHRGKNAVGAILGDGWFSGHIGYGKGTKHYGDRTSLLAQLVVEYRDGTTQIIASDDSWQGTSGPIVYSDLLMGETYDARKIETKWDTASFDAKGWQSAIVLSATTTPTIDVTEKIRASVRDNKLSIIANNEIGGDPINGTPKQLRVDYSLDGREYSRTVAEKGTLQIPMQGESGGNLVIRRAIYGDLTQPGHTPAIVGTHDPAIRVTQQLKPIKVTQPKPATFIFDMGQNMVGVARLKVRGAAGTKVKLRFAEMLNPDGTAYTNNLRLARATDNYICAGRGTEIWEPRFTFHGFRYVEVTGYPGTPGRDAIVGLVIGSDTPKTGTFSSSSPLVNQLQSNIDWGQRGNFLSVPTDCPQRDERLGWMGDVQIFARTATYNRDVAAFFEKWLQDVEDSQASDGSFSNISPRLNDPGNGSPAWGDAGVIVPWTVYQAYGDRTVVDRHWNGMTRWMDYIAEENPDGLWQKRRSYDLGDWLSVGAKTPKDVLATAYYAYDASLMARMARATGREAEAKKYDALFEHIRRAFNTAYVQADGRIKGETQTVYVLALRFNLLSDALRPLAAQHLVADIAAKNGHLSTGFVGVGYLCPTLSDTGHNDVAYKLLLNETFPSWGYSIRQGATTIWERWDGWTQEKGFQSAGMNSFNHYSLGSVGEWLYSYVAGISTDPAFPGYERIVIRPHPGPGLTFAKASYESVRGQIISNWKIENGTTTFDVTIPANTTATVWLPTTDPANIKESGQPLAAVTGIRSIRPEAKNTLVEVGSGSYRFTIAKR